jgi:hypothetical protein
MSDLLEKIAVRINVLKILFAGINLLSVIKTMYYLEVSQGDK